MRICPVGRAALPTPTMSRSLPGQIRRTSHKLPRHCEPKAWQSPPPQSDAMRCRLTSKILDLRCESVQSNGIHGAGDCHVASLLALTEVDGGWSRFADGAAVLLDGPAGRAKSLPPGEGIFSTPTAWPNRVGATLAVARNAGDGVPYGFPFDPRRNAAQNRFSRGEAVRKTVPKDRFSD